MELGGCGASCPGANQSDRRYNPLPQGKLAINSSTILHPQTVTVIVGHYIDTYITQA